MAVPASGDSPRPQPRGLRRWWPVGLAAAALLAASQLLWAWQTWPVRQLLALDAVLGTGAR